MARVGGFITGVLLIYAFRNRMLTRINCLRCMPNFFNLIKKIEVGAMTPSELRCRQTARREELANIGPRCLYLARSGGGSNAEDLFTGGPCVVGRSDACCCSRSGAGKTVRRTR